jgi:hypothetical protein
MLLTTDSHGWHLIFNHLNCLNRRPSHQPMKRHKNCSKMLLSTSLRSQRSRPFHKGDCNACFMLCGLVNNLGGMLNASFCEGRARELLPTMFTSSTSCGEKQPSQSLGRSCKCLILVGFTFVSVAKGSKLLAPQGCQSWIC